MPPSVLALGIPHTSPSVPEHAREGLRKVLEAMHEDMRTSPYDYENLYVDTDKDFQVLIDKLREKRWDIVHIGVGLRTVPSLVPFFENIVNAAHEEVPGCKLAFCTEIIKTQEACQRVLPA